MGPPAEAWLF